MYNRKDHMKHYKAYLISNETLDYTPPVPKKFLAPKMLKASVESEKNY